MLNSLYIGAVGMHAHQKQVDTTSNNLTNMNTVAYKKSQVTFDALVGRLSPSTMETGLPISPQTVGLGVLGIDAGKIFTTGDPKKTDQWRDAAILADGMVEIEMPDGRTAYTRAISLYSNADGYLALQNGLPYSGSIRVPPDATEISLSGNGTVYAIVPNEAEPIEIGQLKLVTFVNSSGLEPIGENLYQATIESGPARVGTYDSADTGLFAQGYVEGANVSLIEEMMNLFLAQRAYEMSAKIVQTSDEMLTIINGLRR